MIDPDRFDSLAYVLAAAPLADLDLTPERTRMVAEALALVAKLGRPALERAVFPDIEPAPIFTA